MGRNSERVVRMKQDFMRLHNEGKTIKEIAEIYNLHYTTVYDYLEEIAKANNIDRSNLLIRVIARAGKSNSEKEAVSTNSIDFKEIGKSFDIITNELNNLINNLDSFTDEFFKDDEEEK